MPRPLMLLLLTALPIQLFADSDAEVAMEVAFLKLDPITIIGTVKNARDVAGGASLVSRAELQEFETTNPTEALRRVPGVSIQFEDGYGLRPNISIRGTPAERSSRITLLEDNVLIAPAPYAAPAAYYFPTFGRIQYMEVLKGPSSITQGPYTIGGAVNLLSTPIPAERQGMLQLESGSDNTRRGHAWYGGSSERTGWLLETHQWQSDGYQHVDRNVNATGLNKKDYLAKFSFSTDAATAVYQQLDIKLQYSQEDSEQTYVGLSDTDFNTDPLRRYGLTALDNMNNEHNQIMLTWRIEPNLNNQIAITAYNNNFERAWYKTEGMDFNGSENAQSFKKTSWFRIIDAVNRGGQVGGISAEQYQAVLDGGDTAAGAIQIRNNARQYYARGLQLVWNRSISSARTDHQLQFGLRYHEDQEDRLQRNDSFQQAGGTLLLSDRGLEGNAGNRIQSATALAAYVYDRINWGNWTFTPGLRFESIEQTRVDYGADPSDLAGRDPSDIKRKRSNQDNVWIPGMGITWDMTEDLKLIGGVYKGFSAPGNKDGVNPEESVNYEAGIRYLQGDLQIEAIAFYNDYANLQGVCTASSGSDCEIGDVFNGNAVSVPGLELMIRHELAAPGGFKIPLLLTYTWMQARFEGDINNSEFFGDVRKGDPVPYVPDNQAFASIGLEKGDWSSYLSINYVDNTCTQASCDKFERTDARTLFDLGVHYRFSPKLELYTTIENLTDQQYIAARQPYGARPGKPRTWKVGMRWGF